MFMIMPKIMRAILCLTTFRLCPKVQLLDKNYEHEMDGTTLLMSVSTYRYPAPLSYEYIISCPKRTNSMRTNYDTWIKHM